MSDQGPEFVMVYRGSPALLSQHTTVQFAKRERRFGYRIVGSGLYPDIQLLVANLNAEGQA